MKKAVQKILGSLTERIMTSISEVKESNWEVKTVLKAGFYIILLLIIADIMATIAGAVFSLLLMVILPAAQARTLAYWGCFAAVLYFGCYKKVQQ